MASLVFRIQFYPSRAPDGFLPFLINTCPHGSQFLLLHCDRAIRRRTPVRQAVTLGKRNSRERTREVIDIIMFCPLNKAIRSPPKPAPPRRVQYTLWSRLNYD